MTKPKEAYDPVATAKAVSKAMNIPLPHVAQVMQKYPVAPASKPKIIADLEELQAQFLKKTLKNYGFL